MKFRNLWEMTGKAVRSVFNKNERLANNIVDDKPATTFPLDHRHLFTCNSADIVPVLVKEVLPGDIWEISASGIARGSSPKAATMESAVWDTYFFNVPMRLLDPYWKEFFGENKNAGPQVEVKTTQLLNYNSSGSYKFNQDDIASYMGIPQNVKFNSKINSYNFGAYIKVYNDYFRDENLQSEVNGNYHAEGVMPDPRNRMFSVKEDEFNSKDWRVSLKWGKGIAKACKLNDQFTTCLPWPQKGDAVELGGLFLSNLVVKNLSDIYGPSFKPRASMTFSPKWYQNDGSNGLQGNTLVIGADADTRMWKPSANGQNDKAANLALGLTDFEGSGHAFTLNDFRLAATIQQMRELDARGGTRYNEYILNHFGIDLADNISQRAQYIGGWRWYCDVQNVVQSSSSNGAERLGMLGGVSCNSHMTEEGDKVEFAAVEHGIIIGVSVIRPEMNYSQGLDKFFTKSSKLDFFDPLLENIGDQPIYSNEICYLTDKNTGDPEPIFGYQEAWYEYKYAANKLSGYMSVNNDLSMASLYAYTEKYDIASGASPVVLSDKFIQSHKDIIGNTLALGGSGQTEFIHQFIIDMFFNISCTRVMKAYSIPGLKRI